MSKYSYIEFEGKGYPEPALCWNNCKYLEQELAKMECVISIDIQGHYITNIMNEFIPLMKVLVESPTKEMLIYIHFDRFGYTSDELDVLNASFKEIRQEIRSLN